MRFLLVEDEVLLLMHLESLLTDRGHEIVGTAVSSHEAITRASEREADIALVDLHLLDGPTGSEVARFIVGRYSTAVVFMTANSGRIPDDFSGAIGVIAKPYTEEGLYAALDYIDKGVRSPPPTVRLPRSLTLAPAYAQRWNA